MRNTELIPITELIPSNTTRWSFLSKFFSKERELFIFSDKFKLSSHIDEIPSYMFPSVLSSLHGYVEGLKCGEDESLDSFFDRIKEYYKEFYGDKWTVHFLDRYIHLDFKLVKTHFVSMNKEVIPANTENIFYFDGYSKTNPKMRMYGSNENEITLNQIFIKCQTGLEVHNKSEYKYIMDEEGQRWMLKHDFSELIAPNYSIIVTNVKAQRFLKACIELNNESPMSYFTSAEIFDKCNLTEYEGKVTKFLPKNPAFKNLIEQNKTLKGFRIKAPIF